MRGSPRERCVVPELNKREREIVQGMSEIRGSAEKVGEGGRGGTRSTGCLNT